VGVTVNVVTLIIETATVALDDSIVTVSDLIRINDGNLALSGNSSLIVTGTLSDPSREERACEKMPIGNMIRVGRT